MSSTALAMITVIVIAFTVPIAAIIISHVLGGTNYVEGGKHTPYESGIISTVGTAQERFSVKFYLTAILFIIFDVEVVFLYPWAVNFKELIADKTMPINGLIEMIIFLTILLAGYVYIWKKGALKWE